MRISHLIRSFIPGALASCIVGVLAFCGRQGRWVLPAGLLAGFLLPTLAAPMRAAIPYLIAVLLFVAWLRITDSNGTNDSISTNSINANTSIWARFAFLKDCKLIGGVLVAQLVLPLVLYFLLSLSGIPVIWCMAAVLVAAAAPISGGPNIVLLMKGDASLALRWLTVGTMLMPLTSIPVLALLLPSEPKLAVGLAIVKLLLIITIAMFAAIAVHNYGWGKAMKTPRFQEILDGIAAILLASMVIGLMSAVHHPTSTVPVMGKMLLLAITINVGLQLLGIVVASFSPSLSLSLSKQAVVSFGVLNGNRNIALFLAALPVGVTEPLLLFIACYQIPMYLTPLVGKPLYRFLGRQVL